MKKGNKDLRGSEDEKLEGNSWLKDFDDLDDDMKEMLVVLQRLNLLDDEEDSEKVNDGVVDEKNASEDTGTIVDAAIDQDKEVVYDDMRDDRTKRNTARGRGRPKGAKRRLKEKKKYIYIPEIASKKENTDANNYDKVDEALKAFHDEIEKENSEAGVKTDDLDTKRQSDVGSDYKKNADLDRSITDNDEISPDIGSETLDGQKAHSDIESGALDGEASGFEDGREVLDDRAIASESGLEALNGEVADPDSEREVLDGDITASDGEREVLDGDATVSDSEREVLDGGTIDSDAGHEVLGGEAIDSDTGHKVLGGEVIDSDTGHEVLDGEAIDSDTGREVLGGEAIGSDIVSESSGDEASDSDGEHEVIDDELWDSDIWSEALDDEKTKNSNIENETIDSRTPDFDAGQETLDRDGSDEPETRASGSDAQSAKSYAEGTDAAKPVDSEDSTAEASDAEGDGTKTEIGDGEISDTGDASDVADIKTGTDSKTDESGSDTDSDAIKPEKIKGKDLEKVQDENDKESEHDLPEAEHAVTKPKEPQSRKQRFRRYMQEVSDKARELNAPAERFSNSDKKAKKEEKKRLKEERAQNRPPHKKRNIAIAIGVLTFISVGSAALWFLFIFNPYGKESRWVYAQTNQDKQVDCFIVGGNTYDGDSENMPLSDIPSKNVFEKTIKKSASNYASLCRIYSPYYAQASSKVLATSGARGAIDRAYRDVKRAFSYYLEKNSENRPIILAGYGQGAELVRCLLRDFYDGNERQSRLVCAYMLDWTFKDSVWSSFSDLKLAGGVSDTGVMVLKKEDISHRLESFFRGGVTSAATFVDALGGLDYARAKDNVITLRADITITNTIVISEGDYILRGDGHTITRSVKEDMFSLYSVSDSSPSLTLGLEDGSDTLIIDGATTGGKSVDGAIVGVYGSCTLSCCDGVTLRNNNRAGYDGSAIYAECTFSPSNNGMYTCLEPRVDIFGGTFEGNTTDHRGAAIAMIGVYGSTAMRYFGKLNIYAGKFVNNAAQGGANHIYSEQAECAYASDIGFTENDVQIFNRTQ